MGGKNAKSTDTRGGGVVVLLFAALTACSDGLSAGEDDTLANRDDWIVHGTVYLGQYPHAANVGLRHVYTSPFTDYVKQTTAGQTGYYEFTLDELDTGYYVCDAWYQTSSGSSTQFYWDTESPDNFLRYIHME